MLGLHSVEDHEVSLLLVLVFSAALPVRAEPSASASAPLLALEAELSRAQHSRDLSRLSPEAYAAWVPGFRARLDEAYGRLQTTPADVSMRARLLSRLGQSESTLAGVDQALGSAPNDPELLRAKGQLLYDAGDYQGANAAALQAWEASGRRDQGAFALMKMTEGRTRVAGDVQAAPQPRKNSAAPSVAIETDERPATALHRLNRLQAEVPTLASTSDAGNPPPSSPYWPWPAGWALGLLGAAWAVKKRLDHEGLTGPLLMTGAGVSLLAASTMFPPSALMATPEGLTFISVGVGQAITATSGSAATAYGMKSGTEQLISRASGNQQTAAQQPGTLGAGSPLRRPSASDPKLQNIINDMFRPGDSLPGGTAGAVRNEILTGRPTGGKFHLNKARMYNRALENVLRNKNLSARDRATAEAMRDDLIDALENTRPAIVP